MKVQENAIQQSNELEDTLDTKSFIRGSRLSYNKIF